ncbi:hypothetical protein Ssi03_59320 [Sphaerisporangium siamense]|uniref:BP74 N-terminal domain-containing protein n=1 Tax=Sphaerisporangium siamense TaxID=795645 RepID=A0A7W7D400_9ACTN|nr:calmodulin-binding protein [Sphaerisporangium siamense]MBB4699762.1 hypothetical protein [Sphaerisporangium siamense]GII87942.1 hypothetical protein Ssi03_59320 [Sphaerisporangium siamense]
MPRVFSKIGISAAAAILGVLAATSPAAATGRAATDPAYFAFTDASDQYFVLKLTDPAKIQHARDLINGVTTDQPHVIGTIVPSQASYNQGWSYHYDPATIDFFDAATEVCDASIDYVEEHLDEAGGAFLPNYTWCPWSSHLVEEVSTA